MNWKIVFYNEKVENSIKEWPDGIIAKFLWVSNVIEKFGPTKIGMPHIKALGQGLFEIRVKANEGIGRALFCMVTGKIVIVLNGFIKKTEKTPLSEIELAQKRMKEVKKS
jgi:phage-related protein